MHTSLPTINLQSTFQPSHYQNNNHTKFLTGNIKVCRLIFTQQCANNRTKRFTVTKASEIDYCDGRYEQILYYVRHDCHTLVIIL